MYHITAILLISIFIFQSKLKSRKLLHVLCLTPLILIIILRYGVGPDFFSYEHIYNILDVSSFGNMMNSVDNIEIGFKMIFYFGRILNLSYAVTIAVVSLIMTLVVALLINDTSDNVPLSYLLFYSCFFLPWNLNAIRQGLAMALALYLLFGKNKFSLKSKIMIVVLLMSLHVSVIVVLPLYYISRMEIGRKKMVIILVLSMIMSILPLNSILSLFENVPFLSKLALYVSSSSGLLDFQSISRIMIILPLLLFYNKFENKVAVNFSLLSFALYFALKSNELIASRMSIYGFFMIIILYPTIYSFEYWRKKVIIAMTLIAVAFSGMFYVKEFNAAFRQSNFIGANSKRNWISILNKDQYQLLFLNDYNLITQSNRLCSTNSNSFFKNTNFEVINYPAYTEGDTFEVVQFPNGNYGVINQVGKIVVTGDYSRKPFVRDHILTTQTTDSHFTRDVHINLKTGEVLPLDEVKDQLLDFEMRELDFRDNWFDIRQMYYEELVDTPLNKLVPMNAFDHLTLISFSQPIWYNVVETSVLNSSFMIFVDNQLKPFNDTVYTRVERFGLSRMAHAYTNCGKEIINEFGEVVWYEK